MASLLPEPGARPEACQDSSSDGSPNNHSARHQANPPSAGGRSVEIASAMIAIPCMASPSVTTLAQATAAAKSRMDRVRNSLFGSIVSPTRNMAGHRGFAGPETPLRRQEPTACAVKRGPPQSGG